MFLECKALYLDDKEEAIKIINGLIATYSRTIYPLLAKFDIYEKFKDIKNMKLTLGEIKKKDNNNKSHVVHTSVIIRTIAMLSIIGEKVEAQKELKRLVQETEYEFLYIKQKYSL